MATDTAEAIESEPDSLYEIIDGEFVEARPMGALEAVLASWLGTLLTNFGRERNIGQSYTEVIFSLRPAVNRSRRPDVAFVSYAKWPKGRRVPRRADWEVIPDLAIEVVSPHDTADEVLVKLLEYFRAGVRQVWIVYTSIDQIHVYHDPKTIVVYGRGDVLEGGDLLPGFALDVAELFGEPEPEEPSGA